MINILHNAMKWDVMCFKQSRWNRKIKMRIGGVTERKKERKKRRVPFFKKNMRS